MEDLPHRHAVVAVGLEVLRHGGVVPRLDPPVGVEVVDPGGVGPAARQHGRATGSAHGLLREEGAGGSEGHLQTWGGPTGGQFKQTTTDLCVRMEEDFAFGRQLVDVWRSDRRVVVAAQRRPQIIGHHQQDIFPLWEERKREFIAVTTSQSSPLLRPREIE